jgi:acyl-coenzyme A thioesterase PaaI-like protein
MPEPLSTTLSLEQLRTTFSGFDALPFVRHFGARAEFLSLARLRVTIDPLSEVHRGGIQGDAVNGGILSAMFDLALGLPGYYRCHPDGRSATVQLSMSFLRALRGPALHTEAWIERASSGLLFTSAETRDAQGTLCATAHGVVRMMAGHASARVY